MADRGEVREAYLSHFAFGPDLRAYYRANRNSVAGFGGRCWCRRVVLDIDRPGDLPAALADARRVVAAIHQRYPELEGAVPVWFTGCKGFAVEVELAHNPPPAAGFHHAARAFAEALADRAGVRVDTAIYDLNHLIRLPNTRHPKTGLFKRRVDADALFRLTADGVLAHARHPAGEGVPAATGPVPQLEADWDEAVRAAARGRAVTARSAGRSPSPPDARAPRYFLDLLRFGVPEGERHKALFGSAAWLAEQGAPPHLCHAILTEPGCDLGLAPRDVARQIDCGVAHAGRQRAAADPAPDPAADPAGFEAWAIRREADPAPGGADFPFGALAADGGGAA